MRAQVVGAQNLHPPDHGQHGLGAPFPILRRVATGTGQLTLIRSRNFLLQQFAQGGGPGLMKGRPQCGLHGLQIRCALLGDAEQRYDRGVGLLPAPFPDGSQQPFFFLFGPAARLLFHGTKRADSFVEADQFLAKLLKTMKLGHFLLRFAKSGGVGKGLGHGLAGHSAGEAELGIMAGVVGLGAMAGRLPQRRLTAVIEPGRRSPKARNSCRRLDRWASKSGRESGMGCSFLRVSIRSAS